MEVIKIGSNGIHDKNFKISRPNGYPHYLFLLIKTPALFIIDNKEIKTESSSAIIYDINHPHYYSSYDSNYINDWIHFKIETKTNIELETETDIKLEAETKTKTNTAIKNKTGTDYFKSLNIPLNTIIKIWDDTFICEMIKLMSNEYYSINNQKEKTMSLLLQTMFVKLSEVISIGNSKKHTSIHYSKLVSLRKEIYNNPQIQWTIDELAHKMNMCNTYFQKIYCETFGISCIADVIACKITYAKDILSKTNMTIMEISHECGYKNDVHFMRQFKKYVGVTPSEYRKNSFKTS